MPGRHNFALLGDHDRHNLEKLGIDWTDDNGILSSDETRSHIATTRESNDGTGSRLFRIQQHGSHTLSWFVAAPAARQRAGREIIADLGRSLYFVPQNNPPSVERER